ncbi:MAG TPA: hypothetical protein VGD67_03920 [Pseudonocardiaceae bacterium]
MTVTLHVWGVPWAGVPRALVRTAAHRAALRRVPGLRFARLLGTGAGRTFDLRDADPRHWALVAAWHDPAAAARFEAGPLAGAWDDAAEERLVLRLRTLAARGAWGGRRPFTPPAPGTAEPGGRVVAITRARLRPSRARAFRRAVPGVVAELHGSPGLRLAFGIGEAPIGYQGTVSVWDSAGAMRRFAHGGAAHRSAIRGTVRTGWYTEDLFARFALLAASGTHHGRTA